MPKPIELKPGDPCPSCGGAFRAAKQPTDKQYQASVDRENPVYLPPGFDTASPDFRAEHGLLHTCLDCHYQTRFPAPPPAPVNAARQPGTAFSDKVPAPDVP